MDPIRRYSVNNMEWLSDGYRVISNFLTQESQDTIEEAMHSNKFPWFLLSNMSGMEVTDSKVTITLGFFHVFIREELDNNKAAQNSPYANTFIDLLNEVAKKYDFEVETILRIRARMTLREPGHTEDKHCGPHVDFIDYKDRYYSLVYYVNDSDGDTYLFNEDKSVKFRSTPKKGNMLLFKGDTVHAGNCPINSPYRTIVNYDFTIK